MMRIEYLADRPEALEPLARGLQTEWPVWAARRGEAQILADLHNSARRDALPSALVAMDGDLLAGSVTLAAQSHDLEPPVSPWLLSLWTDPARRGRGTGAALVSACMEEARRFGYDEVWTGSATAVRLFERLGWTVHAHVLYRGEPMAVLNVRL